MKILVTFASRHGSTGEIAGAIADELRASGHEAILKDVESVKSISDYDAVVLGSSIYIGQWQPEAREFIDNFEIELKSRQVWLFSSGPIGEDPFPIEEPVDTEKLLVKSGAREHQSFTGRLDRSVLGFGERLVSTVLRAPEGDFRDWGVIRAWAISVADALSEIEETERLLLKQAC